MLLGFTALAVDYGRMVATRNHLQRTCDASALAGAAELPATDSARTASATGYAKMAATQNGVSTTETLVEYPATNQIRVTATRQVPFLFARVLGLNAGTVRATALAGRSNIAAVPYSVPLAITVDDYNNNRDGRRLEVRLVDNNRQNFENGTLTALDLRNTNSGKSTDGFQTDLTYGWYAPIYFDQKINSALNASLVSQSQKLELALQARFEKAAGAPWYDEGPGSGNSGSNSSYTFPNYPHGDPRIVTIPVSDPSPANNNNPQLTARFFASIYLESIAKRGGETYVKLRILPGLTYNNEDPNIIIGDDSTTSIGFTVIRLLS